MSYKAERMIEEAKKHPLRPNYVIIPAAGSLVEDLPDMTVEQANELVKRIIRDHGVPRRSNDEQE